MVVIWAYWAITACRSRWALPGSAISSLSMAARIRSRISEAAALVNVITSMRSISAGCSRSRILRMILSTRTAVLPLPAAADTSMLQFLASMTFC